MTPPQSLHVPHFSYLTKGEHVVGEATEVTPRHVVVSLLDTAAAAMSAAGSLVMIPYDVLVVCSGRSYALSACKHSLTSQARVRALLDEHGNILRARHVMIVGGRIVGVELAAAIMSTHGTSKKITLLESSPSLL
jgi:NADH dehydrogenase FAD-containing subunit